MSAALAAFLLLATTPLTPPGPDHSWLIDADIPAHVVAARQEAARFDAAAAESDRLREGVVTRQEAALASKRAIEAGLPKLSTGKRADAEKQIAEFDALAGAQAARAKQLALESSQRMQQASAQRALAMAYEGVAKSRREDDAKHRLAPGADITPLSDARLGEITAHYKRRLARLPAQLAALDAALESSASTGGRGEVFARKEALRTAAAEEEAEIARIVEELRYRADSKSDEDLLVRQMEDGAKAKAAERASPVPTSTGGIDHVDAMLDRVIAEQDAEAAAQAATSRLLATGGRILAAVAGIGVLGAILVFVLRRA